MQVGSLNALQGPDDVSKVTFKGIMPRWGIALSMIQSMALQKSAGARTQPCLTQPRCVLAPAKTQPK